MRRVVQNRFTAIIRMSRVLSIFLKHMPGLNAGSGFSKWVFNWLLSGRQPGIRPMATGQQLLPVVLHSFFLIMPFGMIIQVLRKNFSRLIRNGLIRDWFHIAALNGTGGLMGISRFRSRLYMIFCRKDTTGKEWIHTLAKRLINE